MSDSPHVEIYKSPNSNISWLSCYLTSLPHLVKKKKVYISWKISPQNTDPATK